jgi:hypothetical protein
MFVVKQAEPVIYPKVVSLHQCSSYPGEVNIRVNDEIVAYFEKDTLHFLAKNCQGIKLKEE